MIGVLVIVLLLLVVAVLLSIYGCLSRISDQLDEAQRPKMRPPRFSTGGEQR